MAKYGQDDAFVLVDGYDISGDTFELSPEIEVLLEQTDGFGDSWEEQSNVGVKRAVVAHRSFYDDADNATAEALVGQTSSRVFTAGIEGNAQGKKAICSNGILQRRSARGITRGELHKISAEYEGAKMEDAVIIQHLVADSGGGPMSDGTYVFPTALETGGTAYLQVTALTLGGYTSITAKLRHSPDGAVWADLATFTNVTVAPFAQAVNIAGNIDDNVRAELTLNGAGAGESITLLAALRRG